MKTNKILLGGIAGGVTFFLLGWLVYGILLMNFTQANFNQCSMRPMQEMIWWALVLSNLAFGLLISLICSWSNVAGFMEGARIGGIIGLLVGLSIDLGFYSMSTMYANFTAIVVDVLAYTVMTAIVGAVVAWILGTRKK